MHHLNDADKIQASLDALLGEMSSQTYCALGSEIRAARISKGLKQTDVSEKTGIPQGSLSRIEKSDDVQRDAICLFAIAAVLEVPFSTLVAEGKRFPSEIRIPSLTEKAIQQLEPSFQSIANIRTLIRPTSPTDVRDIYANASLIEDTGESIERYVIKSLDDLDGGPIAIVGLAGQGKSVLLRYLAITECERGSSIPVFIELRTLSADLSSTVKSKLLDTNLAETEDYAELLLKGNQVSVFLDAFDEIVPEERGRTSREIELFVREYPATTLVVSGRPESGLRLQTYLRICSVADLEPSDVSTLTRIYATDDEAKQIISRLDRAIDSVPQMLKTPLLVVMVVIHFRYTRNIPESTVAFYRDLLDVLLIRHNISEHGAKRRLNSNLDVFQMSNVFEAMCFLIEKQFGEKPLHISEFRRIADEAVRLQGYNALATSVADDLIEVTSLVLNEGGTCFFLHRSIKEFHAAVFLKNANDEEASRFYSSVLEKWQRWDGVLTFLSVIDARRYRSMFAVPDVTRFGVPSEVNVLGMYRKFRIYKKRNYARLTFEDAKSKTLADKHFPPTAEMHRGFEEMKRVLPDDMYSFLEKQFHKDSSVTWPGEDEINSEFDWQANLPTWVGAFSYLWLDDIVEYLKSFVREDGDDHPRKSLFDV